MYHREGIPVHEDDKKSKEGIQILAFLTAAIGLCAAEVSTELLGSAQKALGGIGSILPM